MAASPSARLFTSRPVAGPIAGRWDLPGDHAAGLTALACAALSVGRSRLRGLAHAAEIQAFATALGALGVGIDRLDGGDMAVQGRGVGGLAEPDRVLDPGPGDAVAALLLGLVATSPFTTTLGSHFSRDPLASGLTDSLLRIGARLMLRSGGRLPGAILGTGQPLPARHDATGDWARAALLLAGLAIPGRTTIRDAGIGVGPVDGVLAHFGVPVVRTASGSHVTGPADLTARDLDLPGDGDLAALALVAALARPGGTLILPGVAVDAIGRSLIPGLRALGADLQVTRAAGPGGLAVADIVLRPGGLTGSVLDLSALEPPGAALPFLLVAAALVPGGTLLVRGDGGMDHLDRITPALAAAGIMVTPGDGGLRVARGIAAGTGPIRVDGDAGLALALLAWGSAAPAPLTVAGAEILDHRYPGLPAGFNALGGALRSEG